MLNCSKLTLGSEIIFGLSKVPVGTRHSWMDELLMQKSICPASRLNLLFVQFYVLAIEPSSICFWKIKQNGKAFFKICIWSLSVFFKTLDEFFVANNGLLMKTILYFYCLIVFVCSR